MFVSHFFRARCRDYVRVSEFPELSCFDLFAELL